tara:strand:- start:355 stop:696 length:342 start_codon:yes stop_codon:yes gene_type:complete
MIGILSSVANLATTFIDSKAKIKQAEAETKMKLATGEISWEQAAIEASSDSWKDEAWTLCFIAIVLGSFVPWLQPYMKQGFENLQAAPQWFSWAMYASIAASFGIRTMKGFNK